jgi:hypothetical protein
MDSLGLTGVDDITLDGVPMELWEMKARHSSRAADVTLEQEDHLRAVALAARKAEYLADDEARRKARHLEEETPETVTIRRPFQMARSPTPEQIEFGEEKSSEPRPAAPLPESVAEPSPGVDDPSTRPSSSLVTPPPADGTDAGEGIIGWVQRRLSFKGDPTGPMKEPSPLPKPQQPQSESLAEQDPRDLGSEISAEEPPNSEPASPEPEPGQSS